ncbi:hypothetical protein ACQEV2_28760 [Streptomyces sp. CA-251387]|uniref:hypothetical protein n=1 Tax=Streptomyces sp. CA-251387 TaxID=3240064 RepID=UPI003D90124E
MSAPAVTRRSVTPSGGTGCRTAMSAAAPARDGPFEFGAAYTEGARAADEAPESADEGLRV